MSTNKPLRLKAGKTVSATLCGLALLYSHNCLGDSATPEKRRPAGLEVFGIMCKKSNDCTYQIEGPRPGTTSWVYELAGLKVAIPDDFVPEFVQGPESAAGGRVFAVWLPDFIPATPEQRKQGLLSKEQKRRDVVLFEFYQDDKRARPATVKELEDDVVGRRSAPQPVAAIPSLQEYALPGKPSFFRAKDLGIRYPDGLPVYFGCMDYPTRFDKSPALNANDKTCIMQMTWPNGFTLKLHFDQSQLAQWRTILEKGTDYFRTLEANHRLPYGTLALD